MTLYGRRGYNLGPVRPDTCRFVARVRARNGTHLSSSLPRAQEGSPRFRSFSCRSTTWVGRVREGSFNLVFNQATLLPDAERGVAKSFPYPGRHTLTSPLSLSLSLPCSAHARKRRGKVVNARREGGGRRRTALFLDFIQGYILLPFAAKDSARTSRVHLVGGGGEQVASSISSLPPLLPLPTVFSR